MGWTNNAHDIVELRHLLEAKRRKKKPERRTGGKWKNKRANGTYDVTFTDGQELKGARWVRAYGKNVAVADGKALGIPGAVPGGYKKKFAGEDETAKLKKEHGKVREELRGLLDRLQYSSDDKERAKIRKRLKLVRATSKALRAKLKDAP